MIARFLALVASLSAATQPAIAAQHGRPRPHVMRLSATAYCDSGRTRSGERTHVGVVAADPRVFPIGTVLRIPSRGRTYEVLDTGSAIKGRHVDIYMPSCRAARRFGRRRVQVQIVSRASAR